MNFKRAFCLTYVVLALLLGSCDHDENAVTGNDKNTVAKEQFSFDSRNITLTNANLYLAAEGEINSGKHIYRDYFVTDGTYVSGDGRSLDNYKDATYYIAIKLAVPIETELSAGIFPLLSSWFEAPDAKNLGSIYLESGKGQNYFNFSTPGNSKGMNQIAVSGGLENRETMAVEFKGELNYGHFDNEDWIAVNVSGEFYFAGEVEDIRDKTSQEQFSLLFEAGVSRGIVKNDKIREASGLIASVNNPGMLWTHNDSGNDADIFLISDTGDIKCTVHLSGIKNRDWEDIAIGSGPEENKIYLYIGEIGDNNSAFDNKFLYRIEEPVIAESISDTTLIRIDSIEFKLSDGIRDTEAFMIDPVSKNFYIFSKRESNTNLYKLSGSVSTTETMTAEKVLEKLPFTLIVAADISEDGSEILAKNYDKVFYWKRLPEESIEETIKRTPEILPYSPEPQGESIAFDRKGLGYYTLSEKKGNVIQQLFFYKRR